MKKVFFISYLTFLWLSVHCQGLLNNGANIVLNSTAQVVIDGNGNWTNNGTVSSGSSTVHFIGNANQSILGTNTTAFYNVTVNNSGAPTSVIVGRDISISNTLQMSSGDFDLKDYVVDLGTTGTLNNEASTRRIKATDGGGADGQGIGTINATRTNPIGNVANLGLNVNLTGAAVLIKRGHLEQAGTGTFSGNSSVFRYYQIENTAFSGTNITFNECYPQELNGHNPASLIMFQWVNGGGPDYWTPVTDYIGAAVPITKNLYGSTLAWTKVTLGSDVLPLPVELVELSAKCMGDYIDINWATLSEINNDYFSIEKSNDGKTFYEIGIVSGIGNSNSYQAYSFIDYKTNSDINYYRLKQFDYNGSYNYSNIINASCNDEIENDDVVIYNSPHSKEIILSIKGTELTNYQISFIDQLGRILINEDVDFSLNNNKFSINKIGLSAGVYNISLRSDKNIITKHIVISR